MIQTTGIGLGNFVPAQTLLDQVVSLEDGTTEKLLRPGDVIEIDKTIYSHWAVYVVDGYAVHLTSLDSECDIPADEAIVLKRPLTDIAGESPVRINNKTVPAKGRGLTRKPDEEIVQHALNMVGQKVEHNLLTRNMEHYVTEWVYGESWSDQAEFAWKAMAVLTRNVCTPDEAHHVMLEGITTVLGSPTPDSPH